MSQIDQVHIISIPTVHEERGKLAVVESDAIPFSIERVYYLYDVPSDAYRGGHAHKIQESIIIALSGSFEVIVNDGRNEKRTMVNKPGLGLYVPNGIWREIENFSAGAVCLVLASTKFSEEDYIRDYKDFVVYKRE